MSPVSRGRKKAKNRRSGTDRVLRVVPDQPGPCHCPDCSDDGPVPADLIDDLLAGGALLIGGDQPMDALDAEIFGANFVAAGRMAGADFQEVLDAGILPAVERAGTPAALAVLLALGATEAAQRLAAAGVPAPGWAGELAQPVRPGTFLRYADAGDTVSILIGTFERAGSSHGFAVNVDHQDCHAALDIAFFPGELLDDVVGSIQQNRDGGPVLTGAPLDHAEFRWQAERALNARSVHDADDGPAELDEDDDGLGYHLLAELLRTRTRIMPKPRRAPAGHADRSLVLDPVAMFNRAVERRLPPKRKKSDGPAPVYQLKVGLRGAKPPIWRRLEVIADTSLAELHRLIQIAFGWNDGHLHVFETAYGDFGVADEELGHRAEKPVTLEQVAPEPGDKFRYVYDFGDDWQHDILVEKVLDRQDGDYPRCTGGRRAAPPEDCGGIHGYHDLMAILADPEHPDHDDRVTWLGLDSAADFQPARFSTIDVVIPGTPRSSGR
ncbi:MAG TPA: plasmid pRiA4b ORF-3 family protein [Actinoplanes sp.]|nr:plasmid pRiA4b ORF-3 family protein [Actinoplanes sp.]